MRAILIRLLLPLLGLAAIELSFRLGIWNSLVPPESHSGTTIRMMRSLDQHPQRIDVVTIGNSLAEYGIDHVAVGKAAAAHGLVHGNLSMPGSHWMTLIEQSRWLHAHRPEIRGVVIAVSAGDFSWRGNGNYELAIVQPMREPFAASEEIDARFDWNDPESYGVRSALYGYRQAIQFAVQSPRSLRKSLRWFRDNGHPLFGNPDQTGTLCEVPTGSLAECAAHPATGPAQQLIVDQCKSMASIPEQPDWSQLDPAALPDDRRELLTLRQRQIRALGWPVPPVVVLMPLVRVRSQAVLANGIDLWARQILQPLADRGDITLLDYSDFFDRDGRTRCDAFWDLYHQNNASAAELTAQLLPQFESALYARLKP